MFKQIFRLTFVTFVWKQYKRIIVTTLLLFAYLWFVGFAHSEYLDFAAQDENANRGASFLFKWVALLIGVSTYLLYHFVFMARKQHKEQAEEKAKEEAKKKPNKTTKIKVEPPRPGEPDPFAAIRTKDKLRSRAEMIIDKNQD